ncbi:MAG: efflux RND transporter permease subunit, partial [Bacteroidota bacterium]
ISELPIMFLNVTGPFDNVTLKGYAEELQEEIEKMGEILRVDIVGAPEREVQINVDLFRMDAAGITMANIEQAVAGENVIISGGELDMANQKVAVRLNGEFNSIEELKNLVIRSDKGITNYLKDIADIKDGFKDRQSYARLNGNPVLTLNVIKKGGENLVSAAAEIKTTIEDLKDRRFPADLEIIISGDQSNLTLNTLNELTNTIILGFILVTLVLMFFMGIRDALFVGLAVPLSSFIAFAIIPTLGFTLNLVVLFSFILAMGIVVDNAIVVIENTYRIFNEEGLPIKQAAKKAAGEVIAPVFAGTLTTICPFLPLLFWEGTVGEFMGFMPVVMIITLFASLFVAYVINPVFAVEFMKKSDSDRKIPHRTIAIYTLAAIVLGVLFQMGGAPSMGNLMFFMAGFVLLNAYVLRFAIDWFQNKAIVSIKNGYRNLLRWSLDHARVVLFSILAFIILSFVVIGGAGLKVIQFPTTEPNFIYVFNEMPNGTDIELTNDITYTLEKIVKESLGEDSVIVKSMITNVAIGAGDPNSFDQNTSKPHKSKITMEFLPLKERGGRSTQAILARMRDAVKGIPGTKITVDQDKNEPPGSAPIEVAVAAEDFGDLMDVSEDLFNFLDSLRIPGVEKLKWDVDEKRPELLVNINRAKASELGISSGQIGMAIRTALFGKEISKYRTLEDEFPIQLRLEEKYRRDINSILDMNIRYMDMADGRHKSVPISSIADVDYSSQYGGINRTDLEKAVKITTNVLGEYNVADVSVDFEFYVNQFLQQGRSKKGVDITVGGQVEDMAEQGAFLGLAFLAAVGLIILILVTQFNSISNVLIILSQVLLSLIGVLLGHAVLGMEFSVVLSGVGMVVLAGIVVNNGIILLDFIQIMRKQGVSLKEAIIEGSTIRFTPVLLTASSTVLGMVPLAISLNLNFGTLLSDLDPQIFFGGDSSAFWEPLAISIITGLTFATVVTLVAVPVIYYHAQRLNEWLKRRFGNAPVAAETPMDLETSIEEIGK